MIFRPSVLAAAGSAVRLPAALLREPVLQVAAVPVDLPLVRRRRVVERAAAERHVPAEQQAAEQAALRRVRVPVRPRHPERREHRRPVRAGAEAAAAAAAASTGPPATARRLPASRP